MQGGSSEAISDTHLDHACHLELLLRELHREGLRPRAIACRLRDNRGPSVAIRDNRGPSVAISGPQWPSVVISGHQSSSVVISGHQWPSRAIRSPPAHLSLLGNQRQSVVISVHRGQSVALPRTCRSWASCCCCCSSARSILRRSCGERRGGAVVSACMHLHRVLHLETFVLEDVLGGAPVLLGTLGALSGHQWPSVAISGHQWSSEFISAPRHSGRARRPRRHMRRRAGAPDREWTRRRERLHAGRWLAIGRAGAPARPPAQPAQPPASHAR